MNDYDLARREAVVFDLSARTKIELRGADRVKFLQNFCTNDVAALPTGGGCEAFVTTAQAKIIARVLAYALPDSLWLDADPGLAGKIIAHLNKYLITEQVELADRTADYAQFHLTGPKSEAMLENLNAAPLATQQVIEKPIQGIACHIRRSDALAQPGFDLLCLASEGPRLRQLLTQNGAAAIGPDVYEALRIEAGTPEYGKDIDETNLPQEVNRDSVAISFKKGCYLGQETVARILAHGHVNRLLVGLKIAGQTPLAQGTKVWQGDEAAGAVTSSVYSPGLGSAIALAYVRRPHHEPGTQLEVEAENVRLPAQVCRLPFTSPTA